MALLGLPLPLRLLRRLSAPIRLVLLSAGRPLRPQRGGLLKGGKPTTSAVRRGLWVPLLLRVLRPVGGLSCLVGQREGILFRDVYCHLQWASFGIMATGFAAVIILWRTRVLSALIVIVLREVISWVLGGITLIRFILGRLTKACQSWHCMNS